MIREVLKNFYIIKLEKYEIHIRANGNMLETVGYFKDVHDRKQRLLLEDFPILSKYRDKAKEITKDYRKNK